jgi:hypothetical protein
VHSAPSRSNLPARPYRTETTGQYDRGALGTDARSGNAARSVSTTRIG